MQDDLFLSILSMDVYNRGTNQGVFTSNYSSDQTTGIQVGGATIIDSDIKAADGFHAIAYSYGGKTIISYRGTDNPNPIAYGSDFFSGWFVGAGQLAGQALDAANFYAQVANAIGHSGETVFTGTDSSIILTGHSLGGGLAGFVASLTGNSATIFDNMPYGAASLAAAFGYDGAQGLLDPLSFFGPLTGNYIFPNATNVSSISVEGEMLSYVRALAPTAALLISGLGPLGEAAAATIPLEEHQLGNLSTFGAITDPVELHSQALQTILLYAREEQPTTWENAALPIIQSWYDSKIGDAIGLVPKVTGNVPETWDQMQRMIAYSILDTGTGLVFGDTGIRAMFHDDNLLGGLASSASSGTLTDLMPDLASIATEFAGVLAFNKVTQAEHSTAVNGVLSVQNNGQILDVNLGNTLWTSGDHDPRSIVGRDDIINSVLSRSGSDLNEVRDGMQVAFGTQNSAIIDDIKIALSAGAADLTLDDRTGPNAASGVTLYVANDSSDKVLGSHGNDLIFGSYGNDTLDGGDGNDVLVGGSGDDTFEISNGTDAFIGGEGDDKIDFSPSGDPEHLTFYSGFESNDYFLQHNTGHDLLSSINTIVGTSSDDTYTFVGSDGITPLDGLTLDGNGGYDVADFSALSGGLQFFVSPTSDANSAVISDAAGAAMTLSGIQSISATSGNDYFHVATGNDGIIGLFGGYGNDTFAIDLSDGVRNDLIDGGEGDDRTVLVGGADQANALSYVMSAGMDYLDATSLGATGFMSLTMTGTTGGFLTTAADIVLRPDPGMPGSGVDKEYNYNGVGGIFAFNAQIADFEWDFINFDPSTATSDGGVEGDLVLRYGNESIDFGRTFGHISFDGEKATADIGANDQDEIDVSQITFVTADGVFNGLDVALATVDWTPPYPSASPSDAATRGGDGDDNLTGTNGDDLLAGGHGSDTYTHDGGSGGPNQSSRSSASVESSVSAGSGNDTIGEFAGGGSNDTLNIGTEFSPQDVTVSRTGNGSDFKLSFSDGSTVTLLGEDNGNGSGVENIHFADGTVWHVNDLEAKVAATEAGTPDALIGFASDDTLTGSSGNDRIAGNGGDDVLIGGGGYDVIDGGTGNDAAVFEGLATDYTYSRSADGKVAIASIAASGASALLSNVETLRFTGDPTDHTIGELAGDYGTSGNDNDLQGNANDNALYGLAGDDVLIGLAGNDTIDGGGGSDEVVFVGSSSNYSFVRNSDGSVTVHDNVGNDGVDTLINIESVHFQGNDLTGGIDDFAGQYGTSGNDTIHGTSGSDQLFGLAGDDVFVGSGGNDVIFGGSGHDEVEFAGTSSSYALQRAADGSAFVTDNTNGAQVLLVDIEAIHFDGDNVSKSISEAAGDYGTANNDSLAGTDGDDNIYGLGGDDTLVGGLGNDHYFGGDGLDQVDLSGAASDYTVSRLADGSAQVSGPSGQQITLVGVENVYFETTAILQTVTALAGAYGTSASDNVLAGTAGDDTLYGLAGNDVIYGYAGSDTLHGGTGSDTMYGGGGNDTYFVDNAGDIVSEQTTSGVDDGGYDRVDASISYTLPTYVEELDLFGTADLNGTGTSAANTLSGNLGNNNLNGQAGNDILYGNAGDDTLQGGGGADSMYGGSGNDYYYVDNISDVVSEQTTAGTDDGGWDQVEASISYTLPTYVEEMDLLGTANINATGNGLDNYIYGNTGNNVLSGLAGNDTLDASAGGRDTLVGGDGDDIYWIANSSDVITETNSTSTGGWDDVWSSVSYTLPTNVEELDLLGSSNLTGTGNTINNFLYGNNGNNVLSGLGGNDTIVGNAGNDTLNGGTGSDTFVFAAAGSANGVDNIQDFVHGTDILQFTGTDYGFATGHTLTSSEFTVGSAAVGSSAQFVWNSTTHTLYFDDDGTGGHAAIAVATFGGGATLTSSDFHFV